ncbi:MAG: crossover junction endodeoxyribonuclease RuvC [Candidatus Sumerlaeia bacterium]
MIVLGIDPGLSAMGWGVVETRRGPRDLAALGFGVLHTTNDSGMAARLRMLFEQVSELISLYRPTEMAVEEIYFERNVKTAIVVAQSKGVAMAAAGCAGLCSFDYSPLQVKLALTGYGKAQKDQVQRMVQRLLGLQAQPRPSHAADALAVAVTHIHHQRLARRAARHGGVPVRRA